jgi:hypothetical protein
MLYPALDVLPVGRIPTLKVARKKLKRVSSAVKKEGLFSILRRVVLEPLQEVHEHF